MIITDLLKRSEVVFLFTFEILSSQNITSQKSKQKRIFAICSYKCCPSFHFSMTLVKESNSVRRIHTRKLTKSLQVFHVHRVQPSKHFSLFFHLRQGTIVEQYRLLLHLPRLCCLLLPIIYLTVTTLDHCDLSSFADQNPTKEG